MPRDTNLILIPINLRHANLDFSAYEEAVAMARRRGAKLLVVTVAPEMERNLQITDSKEYWGKALNKFIEAYPAEGVELETVLCLRRCQGLGVVVVRGRGSLRSWSCRFMMASGS